MCWEFNKSDFKFSKVIIQFVVFIMVLNLVNCREYNKETKVTNEARDVWERNAILKCIISKQKKKL